MSNCYICLRHITTNEDCFGGNFGLMRRDGFDVYAEPKVKECRDCGLDVIADGATKATHYVCLACLRGVSDGKKR